MTGPLLLQLLAAIGGSSALTGLISWMATRRKNSAEVAEVWGRLTGDALSRAEEEIIRCQTRCSMLAELNRSILNEMDVAGMDTSESRKKLRMIESYNPDVRN